MLEKEGGYFDPAQAGQLLLTQAGLGLGSWPQLVPAEPPATGRMPGAWEVTLAEGQQLAQEARGTGMCLPQTWREKVPVLPGTRSS